MTTEPLAAFETALAEYEMSVTRVERATFDEHVHDAVTPPAVGVALEPAFGDPDLALSGTDVTVDPTPVELRAATTGVTGARLGVGEYGSVALRCTDRGSDLVSLYVDRHVVVLRERDVVAEMETAIDALDAECRETRGSTILATGPSATADMGALVQGAHGPSSVAVLVIEGGTAA